MATAVAIVIIILLFTGAYFMWRFMLQRAIRAVVATFREHKATNAKRAATLETLGLLQPRGVLGPAFRRRDHRQTVLRVLAQDGVIQLAEGEKFYLSEDTLAHSRLKAFAKIT